MSVTCPATTWPAAVSERSAALLAGPARGATVLAVFPLALYLRVDGQAPVGLLPVVAATGLRLPHALVLGSTPPLVGWGVQPGDRVRVGDEEVSLPGATIRVARVWRPVRVPTASRRPGATASRVVAGLASRHWLEPARHLATGALAGDLLVDQVAATVGVGPGLTPSGDDMLCGVLLALRSVGASDAVTHLWRAVRPRISYTTTVSASLLTEAADGYAVPAVIRLATALGGGREVVTEVTAAAREVAAIGHTSGADLLAGLVGGLEAVRRDRTHGTHGTLHTVVPQQLQNSHSGVAQ